MAPKKYSFNRMFLKNSSMASGKPISLKDGGGLTVMVLADGVGRWRLRYFLDARKNRRSFGTGSRAAAATPTWLAYLMNQT